MRRTSPFIIPFLRINTIGFVLFLTITNFFVVKIPFHQLFSAHFSNEEAKNLSRIFHGLIMIFLSLYLIKHLFLNELSGIKLFTFKNPALLLIPLIYPMGLAITNFSEINFNKVDSISLILMLAATISKGIAEEITFRGLLQSYLLKKHLQYLSPLKLVLISSIIFGLMHVINITRYSYVDIINQVIGAFYFGVFFGALLLRVKNVFILGVIHGLINFSFSIGKLAPNDTLNQTEKYLYSTGEILSAIITYIIVFTPMLIIGWILLRHSTIKKLTQNFAGSANR